MSFGSAISRRMMTAQAIVEGLASVLGQIDAIAAAVRSRAPLNAQDLNLRCRAGIEYRLAYGIAGELVDAWGTASGADGDATSALDTALKLQSHVETAIGEGRHHGHAWLWLVSLDPNDDTREPLKPGTPCRIQVLAGPEVVPGANREDDPGSENWTRPTHYQIAPKRHVAYLDGQVHWTRLVRVSGLRRTVMRQESEGSGAALGISDIDRDGSVCEVYGQEIDAYLATQVGTVRALLTKTTLFLQMATGGVNATKESEAFGILLREMVPRMGIFGIGLISDRYTINRHDVAVNGVAEALGVVGAGLSVPEAIPLSKIFGTPPGGLSTDDVGSARMWEAFRRNYRTSVIEPVILEVYERLLGKADRSIEWDPPAPATATEAADLTTKWAAELGALVSQSILTPDEARALYFERLGREAPTPDPVTLAEPDEAEVERIAASLGQKPAPPAVAADAKTYQPPEGAQGNARKVLRWREEHGDAVRGMTRVGWTRASQLASGDPVSRDIVGRMAAFARHKKNANVAPEFEAEPWRDAGYVAWLGWGGDTGVSWAAEIVERGE